MKVLLIEDDRETCAYIVRGLNERGYNVDVVNNGQTGLQTAARNAYDVAIVDRMLPGLDGVSLVVALRGLNVETPILFLTALGGVSDRVRGLEAGGDDYLIKPFAFAELLARINTLARRPPLTEPPSVLSAGDLELNLFKRSVRFAGQRIDLQSREIQILEYFLRNPDRIVTRSMLLEAIWNFHFDPQTNIVETHISRLRSKLAREGVPSMIQTVRGAGYILRVALAANT